MNIIHFVWYPVMIYGSIWIINTMILRTACGDYNENAFLNHNNTNNWRDGILLIHTNPLTSDQKCIFDIDFLVEQQTDHWVNSKCQNRNLYLESNSKLEFVDQNELTCTNDEKYEALVETACTNPSPAKYIICRSPSFLFPKESLVDGRSDAQPLEPIYSETYNLMQQASEKEPEPYHMECVKIERSKIDTKPFEFIDVTNFIEPPECSKVSSALIDESCVSQACLGRKDPEFSSPIQFEVNDKRVNNMDNECENQRIILTKDEYAVQNSVSDARKTANNFAKMNQEHKETKTKRRYLHATSVVNFKICDADQLNLKPKKIKTNKSCTIANVTALNMEQSMDIIDLTQRLFSKGFVNSNAFDGTTCIEIEKNDHEFCQRIGKDLDLLTNSSDIKPLNHDVLDFEKYYESYKKHFNDEEGKYIIRVTSYNLDGHENHCDENLNSALSATKDLNYCLNYKGIKASIENCENFVYKNINIIELEYPDKLKSLNKLEDTILRNKEISLIARNKIAALFITCIGRIQSEKNFTAKCRIFSYYVYSMFMCKQRNLGLFTLKPELWNLQLFMPEIYFYIIWRLRAVDEAVTRGIDYAIEFFNEMACIYCLLDLYYSCLTVKEMYTRCLEERDSAIKNYRSFIMNSLELNHKEPFHYLFYNYAIDLCKNVSKKSTHNFNADVMFLLAFAKRSQEFDQLAKENRLFNTLNDRNMNFTQFRETCLSKTSFKMEMIKILHCLVAFMQDIKKEQSEVKTNEGLCAYKVFKVATIIVSLNKNTDVIGVKLLKNSPLLQYFHTQIYEILKK